MTPDSTQTGASATTPQQKLDKFLMETSGGFHATDADWTTVGRDKDGFPVVKGSPEDVSAPPPASSSSPTTAAVSVGAAAPPPANVPSDLPSGAAAPPVGAGGSLAATAGSQVNMPVQAVQIIKAGVEVAKGGPTVTMIFPHRVLLTVTHAKQIEFEKGTQEVPEEIADHPYLAQNGVKKYEKAAPSPNPITGAKTQAGDPTKGALGGTK